VGEEPGPVEGFLCKGGAGKESGKKTYHFTKGQTSEINAKQKIKGAI
jgi:hypothetical protein